MCVLDWPACSPDPLHIGVCFWIALQVISEKNSDSIFILFYLILDWVLVTDYRFFFVCFFLGHM